MISTFLKAMKAAAKKRGTSEVPRSTGGLLGLHDALLHRVTQIRAVNSVRRAAGACVRAPAPLSVRQVVLGGRIPTGGPVELTVVQILFAGVLMTFALT